MGIPEPPEQEDAISHLWIVGRVILSLSSSALRPSRYLRSIWLCGWRLDGLFDSLEIWGGSSCGLFPPVLVVRGRPRFRGAVGMAFVGEGADRSAFFGLMRVRSSSHRDRASGDEASEEAWWLCEGVEVEEL